MTNDPKKSEFISTSPDETFAFAKEIGRRLQGGEILLYRGGLGAGKTLFTKGLMDGLGFDADEVTSPSFALVNVYKARFDFYHIDLWRLEGAEDAAFFVGLDEILENPKAVVAIEWSERLLEYDFARPATVIEISPGGPSERKISVHPAGFVKSGVRHR